MNDRINEEISKLENALQSNIGEQEAYAVRYAILILKDVQKEMEKPLKPIEASEAHKKLGYLHDCPKCGYAVGYKEKRHGSIPRWMRRTVLYEECCQYCTFCGQKLDWSPDFQS